MFLGSTLPYSHHSFLKTLKQWLSNAELIFYNLCCLITFGISFCENNEEVSQSYVCFYWLPLFIHYLIYLCHAGNMHDTIQIKKHWQSTCKCRKGSCNSTWAIWVRTVLLTPVMTKILGFGNFFPVSFLTDISEIQLKFLLWYQHDSVTIYRKLGDLWLNKALIKKNYLMCLKGSTSNYLMCLKGQETTELLLSLEVNVKQVSSAMNVKFYRTMVNI